METVDFSEARRGRRPDSANATLARMQSKITYEVNNKVNKLYANYIKEYVMQIIQIVPMRHWPLLAFTHGSKPGTSTDIHRMSWLLRLTAELFCRYSVVLLEKLAIQS